MLTTMTNQEQQHRYKMFTIFVLRILEREKEWGIDTVDIISDAAMDLRLADMDSEGNFVILETNKI
jgi:hypothetical protein